MEQQTGIDKSWRNLVLQVIIIATLGFIIFKSNSIYTNTQEYNTKIEILQSKINTLSTELQTYQAISDSLLKVSSKIDSTLIGLNTNIIDIKAKTNEKINSVNDYTLTELQQFFTARYSTQERFNSSSTSSDSTSGN